MKIEIKEQEILTEVLERNNEVHEKIKREVVNNLVEKLVKEMEDEYISKSWMGKEGVSKEILEDLENKQKELVIKILKEFYDSYRYKKSNLEILKKLKEFIGEN